MPRKTKAIPDDRADWTFGDALYWHFFIHGTRPEGSPQDKIGTVWDPKRAAAAIGVTIRAFWNWIDDRFYPYNTVGVEKALFGPSKLYDDWREELRRLLQQARERRAASASAAAPGNVPAVVQAQAVTVYTTPFEASEVDGPLDAADFRAIAPWSAENIGKTSLTSVGSLARRAVPSRRSVIKVMVAGLVLLLGAYGVKRVIDDFKAPPASVALNPSPPMRPAPQPPKQEGPTLEEQRAAQAKREAEAKREADARREAEIRAAADADRRERDRREAEDRAKKEKEAQAAADPDRQRREAEARQAEEKQREDERRAVQEREAKEAAERERLRKEAEARAAETKRREQERLRRGDVFEETIARNSRPSTLRIKVFSNEVVRIEYLCNGVYPWWAYKLADPSYTYASIILTGLSKYNSYDAGGQGHGQGVFFGPEPGPQERWTPNQLFTPLPYAEITIVAKKDNIEQKISVGPLPEAVIQQFARCMTSTFPRVLHKNPIVHY